MAMTSVWIGYGCRVDPSIWDAPVGFGDFEDWFVFSYRREFESLASEVPFERGEEVILVPLAVNAELLADFLGIMFLSPEMVFALDEVTQCIPQERLEAAYQQWERFRQAAAAIGYGFPGGKLLFAHLYD